MGRIYLRYGYGGWNTNEKRISAGEYDVDDPLLMGIAEYLVETKHAVIIESEHTEVDKFDVDVIEKMANPSFTLTEADAILYADKPIDIDSVTFTRGAESLFAKWGIDSEDAIAYFENLLVTRVSKPDALSYIDSLDDDS